MYYVYNKEEKIVQGIGGTIKKGRCRDKKKIFMFK